jgi:hypothetical protein
VGLEDSEQLETGETVDEGPHLRAGLLRGATAQTIGGSEPIQGLDHPGEGLTSQAHVVRVGLEAGGAAHQQPERVRILHRRAAVRQPEVDHLRDQVVPRLDLVVRPGHQRGCLVVEGLQQASLVAEQAVDRTGGGVGAVGHTPDGDAVRPAGREQPRGHLEDSLARSLVVLTWSAHA